MSERYSVVQDPCGIFFIWDELKFEPIMADDGIMVFVTAKEANRAALRMNGPANDDSPDEDARRLAGVKELMERVEAACKRDDLFISHRSTRPVRSEGALAPEPLLATASGLSAF